jgi:hypothetical protein
MEVTFFTVGTERLLLIRQQSVYTNGWKGDIIVCTKHRQCSDGCLVRTVCGRSVGL